MNNDDRKRFVSNAYIIVGLIAVILIFWVLFPKTDSWETWEAIALNLATELLGVVIVFYLFSRVLLGKEWSLVDKVEELIQEWGASRKSPTANDFFKPNPDIIPYIQQSQKIDMCGVVLSSTIRTTFTTIINGIRDGKHFRILLTDEEAVKASAVRGRPGNPEEYVSIQKIALSDLGSIMRETKGKDYSGSRKVRLLNHSPTMSIKAFDSDRQASAKIFVEFYPFKVDDILHFSVSEQDGEWLIYFRNLFEELWSSGTDWKPVESAT
jgi:hypothetical protein